VADASTVSESPQWWLKRLNDKLGRRCDVGEKFDRYYQGAHDLRFASPRFKSEFASMFLSSTDNWMPIVVDSVQERLRVDGFRLGDTPSSDRRVWKLWQQNNLDADSDVLHTESLINGTAYTLVWPDVDDPTQPRITIEHPTQMIVEHAAGDRRIRRAALKKWLSEDGFVYATLYLPDFVYKFRSRSKPQSYTMGNSIRWEDREVAGEPWPLSNPFGRVPVTPIANQRRMLGDGESELAGGLTSLQDKINKLVFDMMLASEFAAFRQRWVTGMDIPRNPETNEPLEPFNIAVNRLLVANPKTDANGEVIGNGVQFGEFSATDLNNYVQAIDMQVMHLASQSKTPPHYLNASADRLSGESIKAAETGLVAKVRARQRGYGEGWEDTMRLALEVAGIRPKGGAASMEVIWGDPESRTESQHVDSVLKKLSLGVPLMQLWRDLGYSEETIASFKQMLVEETQYRASMPPPPVSVDTIRQTVPATASDAGTTGQ
jgi:hypothetical protein